MFVVDLHCDTLGNVTAERPLVNEYNTSDKHPSLQLFAAFVPRAGRSSAVRRRELLRLSDVYASECSRLDLQPVRDARELNTAFYTDSRAAMLSLEGGGGLFADSDELVTLYKMGLRVAGLVWDDNELGCSAFTECDTGLSREGVQMVSALSQLGIIVDLSHASDKTADGILTESAYPVIATHSCFREVCGNKRNLPRTVAEEIAARGGIVGLSLYPPHISGERAGADDFLRQVDYGLSLLGEGRLALGCDIDGTDGRYPDFVSTDRSIHDAIEELLLPRYGERVTEAIMGGNAVRFFKENL